MSCSSERGARERHPRVEVVRVALHGRLELRHPGVGARGGSVRGTSPVTLPPSSRSVAEREARNSSSATAAAEPVPQRNPLSVARSGRGGASLDSSAAFAAAPRAREAAVPTRSMSRSTTAASRSSRRRSCGAAAASSISRSWSTSASRRASRSRRSSARAAAAATAALAGDSRRTRKSPPARPTASTTSPGSQSTPPIRPSPPAARAGGRPASRTRARAREAGRGRAHRPPRPLPRREMGPRPPRTEAAAASARR